MIEIKARDHNKDHGQLSEGERWIRTLIYQKKVRYLVKDVTITEGVNIEDRKTRNSEFKT